MRDDLVEISARIAQHLTAQHALSLLTVGEEGGCAYRGRDGTKCAVGCLIADEAYQPSLEGKFAGGVIMMDALSASGIPTDKEALKLLVKWQRYHDGQSGGPSYFDWLEGENHEAVSPEEFHRSLL